MSGPPKRLGNRDRQLNFYPKRPWPECVPDKNEALKVIRLGIPTPHVFRVASSLATDWTAQEKTHIEVVAEYLAIAWQVAAAAALKPENASGSSIDSLRGQLAQAKTLLVGVQKNKPELAPLIAKTLTRVDDMLRQVSPRLGWGMPASSPGAPAEKVTSSGPLDPSTPAPPFRRPSAGKEDEKNPWWKKVFK